MSHLKKWIERAEESLIVREEVQALDPKRYTCTIRLDSIQVQYIDMLAKKLGFSRSALVSELATSACLDAMEGLGVTEEFYKNLKTPEEYDV